MHALGANSRQDAMVVFLYFVFHHLSLIEQLVTWATVTNISEEENTIYQL